MVPTEIDADEVQRLVRDNGAVLLEVLPRQEYEEEHLPGAINIPLKRLTHDAVVGLDRSRPVIAYCHDDL
jgi:rhodanese-related sulfurtransferase